MRLLREVAIDVGELRVDFFEGAGRGIAVRDQRRDVVGHHVVAELRELDVGLGELRLGGMRLVGAHGELDHARRAQVAPPDSSARSDAALAASSSKARDFVAPRWRLDPRRSTRLSSRAKSSRSASSARVTSSADASSGTPSGPTSSARRGRCLGERLLVASPRRLSFVESATSSFAIARAASSAPRRTASICSELVTEARSSSSMRVAPSPPTSSAAASSSRALAEPLRRVVDVVLEAHARQRMHRQSARASAANARISARPRAAIPASAQSTTMPSSRAARSSDSLLAFGTAHAPCCASVACPGAETRERRDPIGLDDHAISEDIGVADRSVRARTRAPRSTSRDRGVLGRRAASPRLIARARAASKIGLGRRRKVTARRGELLLERDRQSRRARRHARQWRDIARSIRARASRALRATSNAGRRSATSSSKEPSNNPSAARPAASSCRRRPAFAFSEA